MELINEAGTGRDYASRMIECFSSGRRDDFWNLMADDQVCDHIGIDVIRWDVAETLIVRLNADESMWPRIFQWAAWGNEAKLWEHLENSRRRNPPRKCHRVCLLEAPKRPRFRSLKEMAKTLPEVLLQAP
jgi:hypothetical protein